MPSAHCIVSEATRIGSTSKPPLRGLKDSQAAMRRSVMCVSLTSLCSRQYKVMTICEGGIPCQLVMLLVDQHQALFPAWHQALAAVEQLAFLSCNTWVKQQYIDQGSIFCCSRMSQSVSHCEAVNYQVVAQM